MTQQLNKSLLDFRHLILSSGGTRAILSSVGAILALEKVGLKNEHWISIGGLSGGSIIAALYANLISSSQLYTMALELEFSSLLSRSDFWLPPWAAVFSYNYFWSKFPGYGSLTTEKLGEYINRYVSSWPDRFWTLASTTNSIIEFRADGTNNLSPDHRVIWSRESCPDIATAIRASCTVPGLMEPVFLQEQSLHDGVLTPYGSCPVGFLKDRYNFDPGTILGVDAELKSPCNNKVKRMFAVFNKGQLSYLWRQLIANPPLESTIVYPSLGELQGLDFNLTARQKQALILQGYLGTLETLAADGFLDQTLQDLVSAEKKKFENQTTFESGDSDPRLSKLLLSSSF